MSDSIKFHEKSIVEIFNALDTWTQSCILILFLLIISAGLYSRYRGWKASGLKWWQFFNPFKKLESPFEFKMMFIGFGIFIFVIIAANLIYFLFWA